MTGETSWTLEEEIQKNKNLQLTDVESLRKFSVPLPNVSAGEITDQVIVAILHSVDYNLEQAEKIVTNYFDIRYSTPEVFSNRCIDNDNIRATMEAGYTCVMPQRSPQGHRVVVQSIRQPDPSLFHFPTSLKVQFLALDCCIHEDPTVPGYILLYNMDGVSFRHMFKIGGFLLAKILKYAQEGVPLKIHQCHLLNCNSITYRLSQMLKPMISKKVWDTCKFYPSGDNEKLFKYVPKECVPKNFGGDLPDLETLREGTIEWLRIMQPKVDISTTSKT